ncbi:hypothetical protein L7F22_054201 [Adiantum nelumboides]|nr:hypothetical protein [Adiantum nelumboides]
MTRDPLEIAPIDPRARQRRRTEEEQVQPIASSSGVDAVAEEHMYEMLDVYFDMEPESQDVRESSTSYHHNADISEEMQVAPRSRPVFEGVELEVIEDGDRIGVAEEDIGELLQQPLPLVVDEADETLIEDEVELEDEDPYEPIFPSIMGTPPHEDDFTFSPDLTSPPNGFDMFGFDRWCAMATFEQRQQAMMYWQSQGPSPAGPSTAPTPPTGPSTAASPIVGSPSQPIIGSPGQLSSQPTSGASIPSRRCRRRSSVSGGGSGGGCCGGSDDVEGSAHARRARPPISSAESTPQRSPRTPWGPHDAHPSQVYSVRDGAPVMDGVGRAMRARIGQLCHIQFGHSVMKKWSSQNAEAKNYITDAIQQEFRPAPGFDRVSAQWILEHARGIMSHRRSEARDAFRHGLSKPTWLDLEEWEQIAEEIGADPDRYRHQREAALKRNADIGASHLGSGGYETLRHEFELAVGRLPTRVEESYAYRHGLSALLEQLVEEGTQVLLSCR